MRCGTAWANERCMRCNALRYDHVPSPACAFFVDRPLGPTERERYEAIMKEARK